MNTVFIKKSIFWIIINFIPFLFLGMSRVPLNFDASNLFLYIQLLLFLIFEIFIWHFLLFLASKNITRWLTLMLVLFHGAYLGIIIFSWILFLRYGFFIQKEHFYLIDYIFNSAIFNVTPFKTLLIIVVLYLSFVTVDYFLLKKELYNLAKYKKPFSYGIIFLSLLLIQFLNYFSVNYQRSSFDNHLFAQRLSSIIPQGGLYSELLYSKQDIELLSLNDLNLIPVHEENFVSKNKKNVILIVVEALRYDAIFKDKAAPFIAKLSNDAHSYKFAHSQATDTESSTRVLLSGRYDLKEKRRVTTSKYMDDFLILPDITRLNGYKNAYFSLYDYNTTKSLSDRFDYISCPDLDGQAEMLLSQVAKKYDIADKDLIDHQHIISLCDDLNVKNLKSWLKNVDSSFFIHFYLYSPHFPYNEKPKDRDDFLDPKSDDIQYFPFYRKDEYKNKYLNAVRLADENVKKIFELLSETNHLDDTIIFITGDHGEEFYEHGHCLHVGSAYEETTHVPFIIYDKTQSECDYQPADVMTGHIDFAPTIIDLLGISQYAAFQGNSLCKKENRFVYFTTQAFTDEDAVFYNGYKYRRNYRGVADEFSVIVPNKSADNESMKTVLSEKLKLFRIKQLSYYALPDDVRSKYYPPHHF